MDISAKLGYQFESLEEAKELVKPEQVIITEIGETFYIVNRETFIEKLFPFFNIAI